MIDYLEKNQNQPLYLQIAELIEKEIQQGKLAPGAMLPSEKTLVDDFDVSRVTVRKALHRLTEKGLIYSVKGKGSYIAQQKLKHSFVSVVGLTEEAERSGLQPTNRVVDFKLVAAEADIAHKLGVQVGTPLYDCSRLRLLNEKIVAFERFFIPQAYLPELSADVLQGSKFSYLQQQGLSIAKCQQKLHPALPDKLIQGYFAIGEHTPILVNESLSYLNEQQVLEYAVVYFKSSEYEFELTAYSHVE